MNKSFIFAERISTNNLNLKKMAYVISDDCIACGTCIDECPVEAISEGDIYSINPDVCTVELAQTFARLKLFTRLNNTIYKKV